MCFYNKNKYLESTLKLLPYILLMVLMPGVMSYTEFTEEKCDEEDHGTCSSTAARGHQTELFRRCHPHWSVTCNQLLVMVTDIRCEVREMTPHTTLLTASSGLLIHQ